MKLFGKRSAGSPRTLEENVQHMRAVVITCLRERIVDLRGGASAAEETHSAQRAPDLSPDDAAIWGS
jgi:hypothetical protein